MRALLAALACTSLALAAVPPQSGDKLDELQREFEQAQQQYLETLGAWLPAAYREHFCDLSKEELQEVAQIRRLWQYYIEHGPTPMGGLEGQNQGIFRAEFLRPSERLAEILLIDPETIRDAGVKKARERAVRLGERLIAAQERAGVDIDPTVGKTSPTGIPLPRLGTPHTCLDALRVFERTIVLAKTVAPKEAEAALLANAEACVQVDVQEAEFAMFAQQVRMLTGSIAWVLDPLMAACSRDFGQDKVDGKGSGHQSEVPGKRFPADRARRFGCRFGSEGAGASTNGKQAIYGFAYNGSGHGGPLFARLRNVCGPGIRGSLTSMYTTDKGLKHACQASRGELFLPPGFTEDDLESDLLLDAYDGFREHDFDKVYDSLAEIRATKDLQGALLRYLEARLDAEVEWTVTGIERFLAVGDAYWASVRLQLADDEMRGMPRFEKRVRSVRRSLQRGEAKREVEVGAEYQKLLQSRPLGEAAMRAFVEAHPRSAYGAAARYFLEAEGKARTEYPEVYWFVKRDLHLNMWAYLTNRRLGKATGYVSEGRHL